MLTANIDTRNMDNLFFSCNICYTRALFREEREIPKTYQIIILRNFKYSPIFWIEIIKKISKILVIGDISTNWRKLSSKRGRELRVSLWITLRSLQEPQQQKTDLHILIIFNDSRRTDTHFLFHYWQPKIDRNCLTLLCLK